MIGCYDKFNTSKQMKRNPIIQIAWAALAAASLTLTACSDIPPGEDDAFGQLVDWLRYKNVKAPMSLEGKTIVFDFTKAREKSYGEWHDCSYQQIEVPPSRYEYKNQGGRKASLKFVEGGGWHTYDYDCNLTFTSPTTGYASMVLVGFHVGPNDIHFVTFTIK